MYAYTFDIKGVNIEVLAINLETACQRIQKDDQGLKRFKIESRSNFYLSNTPFEKRTHIVIFNGSIICEVNQKKI